MSSWGVVQRARIRHKLLAMRGKGYEAFNMEILRNVTESYRLATAAVARRKVNDTISMLDELWAVGDGLTASEAADSAVI